MDLIDVGLLKKSDKDPTFSHHETDISDHVVNANGLLNLFVPLTRCLSLGVNFTRTFLPSIM